MATKTEKYRLTKPEKNDYYNIGVFNENMDIIEKEMAGHTDRKDNPHSVTAEQIGAVPTAGGTLTGHLRFANTDDFYVLEKTRNISDILHRLTLSIGTSGYTVLEHYIRLRELSLPTK